jgi:glycosyltransferase involved in cell wall biosynthesis
MPLIYLRHPINLGQGAALQTGMEYAYENGAEYVVTFDADGQHNFEEIPSLLEPLIAGRADITMGTRFKRAEDIAQIPSSRKIILKGAIAVNGFFTGLWLTDAHNGFRALNRTALSKIKLLENRMAHASEILTQIKNAHLRYEEVPVNIVYTDYSKMKGQSSMNSINILIDLFLKKIF